MTDACPVSDPKIERRITIALTLLVLILTWCYPPFTITTVPTSGSPSGANVHRSYDYPWNSIIPAPPSAKRRSVGRIRDLTSQIPTFPIYFGYTL